jgi:hypothetical protein
VFVRHLEFGRLSRKLQMPDWFSFSSRVIITQQFTAEQITTEYSLNLDSNTAARKRVYGRSYSVCSATSLSSICRPPRLIEADSRLHRLHIAFCLDSHHQPAQDSPTTIRPSLIPSLPPQGQQTYIHPVYRSLVAVSHNTLSH